MKKSGEGYINTRVTLNFKKLENCEGDLDLNSENTET